MKQEYPSCVYTKAQLERMMDKLARPLAIAGYGIPKKCRPVADGSELGGEDAAALSPSPSMTPAAAAKTM